MGKIKGEKGHVLAPQDHFLKRSCQQNLPDVPFPELSDVGFTPKAEPEVRAHVQVAYPGNGFGNRNGVAGEDGRPARGCGVSR